MTWPATWPWRSAATSGEQALERAHTEEVARALLAISRLALDTPKLPFARHFEGGVQDPEDVRRAASAAAGRKNPGALPGTGLLRTYASTGLGRPLAVECARSAFRLVSSVQARLILAAHLDDLGEDREARSLAEESLSVGDRVHACYARARLGHLASKRLRNHEALEHYRAGTLSPGHLVNALSWFLAALHIGDRAEVRDAVEAVRDLEADGGADISAEFVKGVRRAKRSIGWAVSDRSTRALLAVRDDAPESIWRILDAFR